MNEKLILLQNKAKDFGITLNDEQLKKFFQFEELLISHNAHTNLVSANDANVILEKHFVDSLSIGHFIKQDKAIKIIDIGSGGGFPIIPISIVYNNCNITAVDSTSKKINFLNQSAKKLKLNNFRALHTRAEELAHRTSFREQFDVVTARAVGNLAQISELCLPLIKLGGFFIAYKSTKIKEELQLASNSINILGGKVLEIFDYNLNLEENYKRNIVAIEKINNTPKEYPRSFSCIKNNPL